MAYIACNELFKTVLRGGGTKKHTSTVGIAGSFINVIFNTQRSIFNAQC